LPGSNETVAHFQLKQAGQQLCVIDIRAGRRIEIIARAGIHPDAPRSSGENRESTRLFRSMKLLFLLTFTASLSSVKSTWPIGSVGIVIEEGLAILTALRQEI
jgi:hypothetical protein